MRYDSGHDRRKADEEDRKRVLKEAFDEWCEAKFAQFGRWSFYGIAATAVGLLGYFVFTLRGRS